VIQEQPEQHTILKQVFDIFTHQLCRFSVLSRSQLSVAYSLLGAVTTPVLQVGKPGDPSLLHLLLARLVGSVHPGVSVQYTQMGQKRWHDYFLLHGCGRGRQTMSTLGTIISPISTAQLGQGWMSTALLTAAK